jgi:hypothetical protein
MKSSNFCSSNFRYSLALLLNESKGGHSANVPTIAAALVTAMDIFAQETSQ